MRYPFAILAAVVLWLVPPAAAQTVDGETLFGWCKSSGDPSEPIGSYCRGFIVGVLDAQGEQNIIHGFRSCPPDSVSVHTARSLVMGWLNDHPERRHVGALSLAAEAFSEKFPCAG